MRLDEVADRARRLGESTLLTDRGEPVARVVPLSPPDRTIGDLIDWWPFRLRLGHEEAEAFADDVEAGRRLQNKPVASHWD